MNAPTKITWPEARFGPETQHWLPRNDERLLDHIPGEDGVPLLGTTLDQLKDQDKALGKTLEHLQAQEKAQIQLHDTLKAQRAVKTS